MGTNYYFHANPCQHCARSDTLHVGKKSGGWSFHFRAHRDRADGLLDITCAADWAKLFKSNPDGILLTEYDEEIKDPLEWLAELERPTKAQQREEDSPGWRGRWSPFPNPDVEWRDPEGFHFDVGEFC